MSRNHWIGLAAVNLLVGLILIFGWILPRGGQSAKLREDIQATRKAAVEVNRLLPEIADNAAAFPPDPKPNVTAWLTSQVLTGLERRMVSNTPNSSGGAELKLKNLKPGEVSNLLGQLTRVNVVVRNLAITDLAGRGKWDVELYLEVPKLKPKEGDTP